MPEREDEPCADTSPIIGSQAIAALRELTAGGPILEEFRPFWQSLEWTLGQEYWQEQGSQAFLGDNVPFKITNDGNLAEKAADLLFASVGAADAAGSLEPDLCVAEIGAGVGLFACYLLDAFRARCVREQRDYYERLTYVVADGAQRMLDDLRSSGVLAAHAQHVEFRLIDAADLAGSPGRPAGLRAVFLNYVLDCLPTAVVRFRGDICEQLHVRTRLARNLELARHTRLTLSEIQDCAASADPAQRRRIASLHRLFALDLEYRPLHTPDEVPFLESARPCASAETGGVALHNFGALSCLECVYGLLVPGGFALINDYADSPFDAATQAFRHQRFAGSSAFGLNLELMRGHFSGRDLCAWVVPPEENRHLASRLLGRAPEGVTVEVFRQRFSAGDFDAHHGPIEQARAHVKAKRHESALAYFTRALERQPGSWALLTEIADFLAYTTRDHAAALRMIDEALVFNPRWAEAWNTRGDCLYYLERHDEAHAAFERALSLKPRDVRALYNLSFTLVQRGESAVALIRIAEALAIDEGGPYRERLVEKQREIVDDLAERRRIAERCQADCHRPAPLDPP